MDMTHLLLRVHTFVPSSVNVLYLHMVGEIEKLFKVCRSLMCIVRSASRNTECW